MMLFFGMCHRTYRAQFKPRSRTEITARRCARAFNAAKRLGALGAIAAGCLGAQCQTVTLGWNASTSVGVTGYRLYWGAKSHSYTSTTNAGILTQATVPSPAPGATNYYAVTAYNSGGVESAFSTEIAYTTAINSRPPPSGMTFAADAGIVTAPFVVSNHIVFQPSLTGVTAGGEAVYPFTLNVPGKYIVTAMVNAPTDTNNSLYVNIDAEPTDPLMIWDLAVSTGFSNQTVCWRGSGTQTAPQFSPKIFTLMTGSHQLKIRGREGNTQLQSVTIAPLGAQLQLVILPGRTYLVNGIGQPGYTYSLQTSSDLKTWSVLNSAVADGSGALAFVDPNGGKVPKQFYRLKQLSPLVPQLQLAILPGRTYLLSGRGQPGYTYAVQTSSDLKTWSVLNSAVADTSGAVAIVDPTGGSVAKRFYRLHQTSP